MKVEILETDKKLGIKKGEVYNAKPYSGYKPMCTQYRNEVI
jgi:hypothetical protein